MPSARELLEEVDALMQRNRGAVGGSIVKSHTKDADAINKAIDAAEQVEIDRLDAAQAGRRKSDHSVPAAESHGSGNALDNDVIDGGAIGKNERLRAANPDRLLAAGASANTADNLGTSDSANADNANADSANADSANADSANADSANADSANTDSANTDSANASRANADSAISVDGTDEEIPVLTDLAITDGAGRVQSWRAQGRLGSSLHRSTQLEDFPVLTDVVEEIDEIDVIPSALTSRSSVDSTERNLDSSHANERSSDESVRTVPVWDASHPGSESLDELAAMAAVAAGEPRNTSLAAHNELPMADIVADAPGLVPEAASPAIEKPLNGDVARWNALAEEIRIQVLQRLDIFMDEGLQSQLRERVQPVVDRASAELVNTINREVGRLLRTYVAEAIEREIEQWRGQNR